MGESRKGRKSGGGWQSRGARARLGRKLRRLWVSVRRLTSSLLSLRGLRSTVGIPVHDGVEVNPLYATISHRVSVDSSLFGVRENVKTRLAYLADRFSLDVEAFGDKRFWNQTGKGRGEAKGYVRAFSVK